MTFPSVLADGSTATVSSWIDGQWVGRRSSFPVRNPATGLVIGRVSTAGISDVDAAVAAADAAFRRHQRVGSTVRAGWCRSAAAAISRHVEVLAVELSREHGKPLGDARAEVESAANGFLVAATTVLADHGAVPTVADTNKRVLVRREPLGVWAVVTPWNFPVNIPVEYLGPALSTGNAVVWKPAPSTARIAALFREVLLESDMPEQLLQLVQTNDVDVAQCLTTHPGVAAVGFTGGSKTGAAIGKNSWDKHLLLELGGNSPIVVLDDADLSLAADAIARSAFWNAGQVCSSAGKILATTKTADLLAEQVAAHARSQRVGDPLNPATTMGPVHLPHAVGRIQWHVDDAVDRGARLVAGGAVDLAQECGSFFQATVLTDVPTSAAAFSEETFGPVASIFVVDSEDDLVTLANAGNYGLVGAVFTGSAGRAFTVSEQMDVGLVVVNDTSNYWELNLPFGGAHHRHSGQGRLGGTWALNEFTQFKTIALDVRG